ncbi:MAG: ComF family protein [Planctomycetia bacterium]|nr:ComF family protein [Planctomycetia bacterium]
MFRRMTEFVRNATQLLYPNTCLICDAPEPGDVRFRHGVCNDCFAAVTTDPFPACPWCAQTVGPHADTTKGCVACRDVALGFERAFRLGPYDGKLRDAILRTKFPVGEGLADMLGRLYFETKGEIIRTAEIDLVAPIPLHWWRKWQRGYNEPEAVGRELATGLNVPFVPNLLRRVRYTAKQAQLTREARRENVKGAFRVRRGARLAKKTVLLVDDVMTTGSTLGEAARTLTAAGAERVIVAVLARA